MRIPTSFRISADADQVHNLPLMWFDGFRELNISAAIYNASASRELDAEAKDAIIALNRAANLAAETCDIQPGSVLIFNNHKFLHARNVIPGERVVFRTYIKTDLRALRAAADCCDGFVFDLRNVLVQIKPTQGVAHA